MSRTTEDRLNELEYLMTHAQQTIEDLDAVVRNLNNRVDALQRELTRIQDQSQGLVGRIDALEGPPADEKPPHY